MEKNLVDKLIEYADEVRKNARVPKSGFRVGAALARAVSEGYNEFEAIAVVSDNEIPVSPCGTCRQALIDFGTEIKVIMSDCRGENIRIMTTSELLPFAFERAVKFRTGGA